MSKGNGTYAASLQGRVALVTGAARGIGRATSLALASRGAAVAVNYRARRAEAEQLANEIRDMGGQCLLVQSDVSSQDEARSAIEQVVQAWKRLDILVNNAGITRDKTSRKMADDDWNQVISVNSNCTYYCTGAAVPIMIGQQFGRVVNIACYVGHPGQANFAANQDGVIAFTKTTAFELARYNITANVISPGFTCTESLSQIPPHILDQIKAKIPMGRLAMPDEIAKAVVFLAADGDYITGQQININGGLHM